MYGHLYGGSKSSAEVNDRIGGEAQIGGILQLMTSESTLDETADMTQGGEEEMKEKGNQD